MIRIAAILLPPHGKNQLPKGAYLRIVRNGGFGPTVPAYPHYYGSAMNFTPCVFAYASAAEPAAPWMVKSGVTANASSAI